MIIVEQSLLNHKTLMTQFVLINFLTLSHIFSLLFLHRRPRTKKEKMPLLHVPAIAASMPD